MKKSILFTLAMMVYLPFVNASDPVKNIESCCPVVYESDAIELSYDVELYSKYFMPAYFNEETNALHFEAHTNVQFVQVYNESGKLEYQLPVMSNKLRMNKNMFSKGDYKFTFLFEGQKESLDTYVRVN